MSREKNNNNSTIRDDDLFHLSVTNEKFINKVPSPIPIPALLSNSLQVTAYTYSFATPRQYTTKICKDKEFLYISNKMEDILTLDEEMATSAPYSAISIDDTNQYWLNNTETSISDFTNAAQLNYRAWLSSV